jgi:DNA-binding response OmpR family regulator
MELRRPTPPADGEKFRVLLAEDEANIAHLLTLSLTKANFECYHAPDGVLAMEAFNTKDPHIVVLDVMMPRMSGQEVCAKIREESAVPIIMLTALSDPEHEMQGFKLGADDYIAKPFNPSLVVARVISNLRRAYRYDQGPEETSTPETDEDTVALAPEGWVTCEACDYMGPREKFEYEDALGRQVVRCPNCKNRDSVIFSLG